jgi:hypothetical protein
MNERTGKSPRHWLSIVIRCLPLSRRASKWQRLWLSVRVRFRRLLALVAVIVVVPARPSNRFRDAALDVPAAAVVQLDGVASTTHDTFRL